MSEKLNLGKYGTTVDVKRAELDKFVQLIKNQFNHGGDKYQLNDQKEFTDQICETFPGDSGVDWVLGTMMKYLGPLQKFWKRKRFAEDSNLLLYTLVKKWFSSSGKSR